MSEKPTVNNLVKGILIAFLLVIVVGVLTNPNLLSTQIDHEIASWKELFK